MPCFLCGHDMLPNIAPESVQFAGDALHERGRYAVHPACLAPRPNLRRVWVTRTMLLGPVPVPFEGEPTHIPWYNQVRRRIARAILRTGEMLGGR